MTSLFIFIINFVTIFFYQDVLFYLYTFMGDSKWSIKNKARVEGSICASYLHRETTYFCSHYFNNFMLSSHNWRNEVECQKDVSMLSVFEQQGRHAWRESIHWLTYAEFKSAHVHVLINCIEVKQYLEYVTTSCVNNFVVNDM